VNVIKDQWCWKSKTLDIEVIDSDLMSVDFTQTGFMLSASLSHSILLVSIDCWILLYFLLLEFFADIHVNCVHFHKCCFIFVKCIRVRYTLVQGSQTRGPRAACGL